MPLGFQRFFAVGIGLDRRQSFHMQTLSCRLAVSCEDVLMSRTLVYLGSKALCSVSIPLALSGSYQTRGSRECDQYSQQLP